MNNVFVKLDEETPLIYETAKANLFHTVDGKRFWCPKSIVSYQGPREIILPDWFKINPIDGQKEMPAKTPDQPLPEHVEIQKLINWHLSEAERLKGELK